MPSPLSLLPLFFYQVGIVRVTSIEREIAMEISDYAFSSCSAMGGLLTVPTYVGLLPFIPA